MLTSVQLQHITELRISTDVLVDFFKMLTSIQLQRTTELQITDVLVYFFKMLTSVQLQRTTELRISTDVLVAYYGLFFYVQWLDLQTSECPFNMVCN